MTVGITGFRPRVAAAPWDGTDEEAVHRALLDLVRRQQKEAVTMDELIKILSELHARGFPLIGGGGDDTTSVPEEDLRARIYAWRRPLSS